MAKARAARAVLLPDGISLTRPTKTRLARSGVGVCYLARAARPGVGVCYLARAANAGSSMSHRLQPCAASAGQSRIAQWRHR